MSAAELFASLRPACCAVAVSHCSLHAVRQLARRLGDVPTRGRPLSSLHEYVVFPLQHVFLSPPSESGCSDEKLVLAVLECLQLLWQRCETNNVSLAMAHLSRLACWMSLERVPGSGTVPASEEVRLAAVLCCHQLLSSCLRQPLLQLFSSSCRPRLGYLVYQLTSVVRHDRLRTLRLAALECLRCLTRIGDQCGADIAQLSAAAFVDFLPGVLSALYHVLAGDTKQGHRVIAKAVEVWGDMVCHVLCGPVDVSSCPSNGHQVVDPGSCDTQRRVCDATDSNTNSGVDETGARVKTMLCGMWSLSQHHQSGVRLSLCDACRRVWSHCSRRLCLCEAPLVELLLILSCDDLGEVSRSAGEVIDLLCARADSGRSLLEDGLMALLQRLPAVVRGHSHERSLTEVTLLEGYLRALRRQLSQLLLSSWRCDALISCLLQLLELSHDDDVTRPPAVAAATPSVRDDTDAAFVACAWRLRYCDDPAVWRRLCTCCRLLGCYGDVTSLLDALVEHGAENESHSSDERQLLWNQLILGQEGEFLRAEHVDGCAQQLLDNIDLHSLVTIISSSSSPSRDAGARSCCLALEAMTHVARVAATCHVFVPALHVLALGPVLECVGCDSDAAVAPMARAALVAMATALQDNTQGVSGMIERYIHRISVHIRSLLLTAWSTPRSQSTFSSSYTVSTSWSQDRCLVRACWLMSALLPHLSIQCLPHLEDCVHAMLSCVDTQYERHALMLLSTLSLLLRHMSEWFCVSAPDVAPVAKQRSHSAQCGDGLQRFVRFHRLQLRLTAAENDAQHTNDDCADTTDNDDDFSSENTASHLAKGDEDTAAGALHVRLACAVCERCARLTDADSVPVRVSALATLTLGLQLVAAGDCADQNRLLPLLHSCWPHVWRAFTGGGGATRSPVVAVHALRCVRAAAAGGGDFLRRRVCDDAAGTSALLGWLRATGERRRLRRHLDDGGGKQQWRHGRNLDVQLRLQQESLECLADVCVSLCVDAETVHAVVSAVHVYLSVHQPTELQDACVKLLCELGDYDGDNVWWKLSHLHDQMNEKERVEYATNTDQVLCHLDQTMNSEFTSKISSNTDSQ